MTVNCVLADVLLQGALAATVEKSCALTGLVKIVKDALCESCGTVMGPVQSGVPEHPVKVAS